MQDSKLVYKSHSGKSGTCMHLYGNRYLCITTAKEVRMYVQYVRWICSSVTEPEGDIPYIYTLHHTYMPLRPISSQYLCAINNCSEVSAQAKPQVV